MKHFKNPWPANPIQRKVLGMIYLGGPLTSTEIRRALPGVSWYHSIQKLQRAGWITEIGRVRRRDGRRGGPPSILWELSKRGIAEMTGI